MKIVVGEESYHTSSRLAWLLILLALIINFALLFLLFILQTDNNFFQFPCRAEPEHEEAPILFEQMPEPPSQAEEPPPPVTNEVAALIPGASNFGIPDEYTEDEIVAHINELEPDDKEPEPELAALEEKKEKEEPQGETPPSQPKSEPTMLEPEQETVQLQPIPSTILEKIIEQPKQPEAPIKQIMQPKPPTQKSPEVPEKIKAPLKKELTFNDIAKGFLSSLDEGGHDQIERKGNENIRPDFEEMRILSYQQKLFWYMQNEWKRTNTPLNFPAPPFTATCISITIDKDGVLKKSSIVSSCGIQQLDDIILQGIRNASPYPPLPTFLKKESYTFDFGVKHVQAPPGFNNHFRH